MRLITTTHQHLQVKALLMLQRMALHMWEMSGIQLVEYRNILTLILLVIDPTKKLTYNTRTSE